MANEIKNPFIYGFYDVEDPFMPIAVQMCGNVQAAIDESLGTINITGSSLTYTLTVNGRNAGTINIPSFVDDVQYDADTKELVFSYGENTIRVSVSDLVDTYIAGEGIDVSGNVISCNLVDDVQSLKDKDVEIENSINTKANASEVYTKAEIDAKGFLTEHQDISGKADVTALNSVKELVDANSSSINAINSSISTIQGDLATKASAADLNTLSNTVDTKIDASALDGYATEAWVEAKNYLTEHQDISALAVKADVEAALATKQDKGDYALRSELPVIPTNVSSFANDAEYQTLSDVNNALEAKQDKGDYALNSAIPTQVGQLTNDANYQTAAQVNAAIQAVVGAAPEALDTLEEIAAKLGESGDAIAALTSTIATKANSADVYTKTEVDNSLTLKANAVDVYTKQQIDAELAAKANASNVYTKSEIDNKGFLTEHQSLTAYSTTEQVTAAITTAVAPKANADDVYTKTEIDSKGFLTEHQSLDEYAKTADVTAAISDAVAPKANAVDVYTKAEVDESQNAQDNVIVTKADANSVLSRIQMLEEKIAALSKTNVETVDVASSTEPLNDSSKDYILNGDATSTLTVTGKSVAVADATVSSDARVKIVAGDVEIKGTEFSGKFPKSTSNAVVSLNSAEYVTIKDTTFDSTSSAYNAIEIGLTSTATTLPKSVLIENCKFEGDLSNNAILIFATQDNAVINLNNCTFENVSNPLRISNRTNAKNVTINVTNCTVNKWETRSPYQGFLLCQDYTSTTAEYAEENNLFGGNKITVNFINLVGPNGKVTTPSDISTVCGSADENQIVYVYRDKGGIVAYDANKFPVVNIL